MEIAAQILGWMGAILFLVAYFLVTFKKIEVASRSYQILNLKGAIALGINVFYQQAWPALALEIIWGTIAIVALMKKA